MKMPLKTDILILGAGIGGYETFRTLTTLLKRKKINKQITIVDQNNYFTFVPLLHEAATGAVEPDHCAIPIRELIHKIPHKFFKAKILKIHPGKKQVETDAGLIDYTFCVVALGSRVNYYETPGADMYTHNVRTLSSALKAHKALVQKLEDLDHTNWTVTVVGGGATGVELAGQLADMAHHDVKKLYPNHTIRVQLIQGNKQLVPHEHPTLQRVAKKLLKKAGVELYLNTRVTSVKKHELILSNSACIESDITFWAAGVEQEGDCYLDKKYCGGARIPVTSFLHHKKIASLYAVGDIAEAKHPETNEAYPQLGEAAHKEGKYVAKHIVATLTKKQIKPFVFKSAGTLMAIGNGKGIGKVGPFFFHGWIAWWIRRLVYLRFMPEFSRKFRILIDWMLHLFGSRYIIDIDTSKKQSKKLP